MSRPASAEVRVVRRMVQRLMKHPDDHAAMEALRAIKTIVSEALGKSATPPIPREDPRLKQYRKNSWNEKDYENLIAKS